MDRSNEREKEKPGQGKSRGAGGGRPETGGLARVGQASRGEPAKKREMTAEAEETNCEQNDSDQEGRDGTERRLRQAEWISWWLS